METDSKGHTQTIFFLATIISVACNLLLMVFGIWIVGNLNYIKESLGGKKIVESIVTNKEDEAFIKEVCDDLGLENEVTVVVGPYYVHSFFSPLHNHQLNGLLSQHPIVADPEDPTRKILMKESIYKELSAIERKAAIAHQIWHIYSYINNNNIAKPGVNEEINANRFTVKYVTPEVLISLYRKYGNGGPEVWTLISELEKYKLTTNY